MLWEAGDSVGYDCDCPVGQEGDFCKHCVATALAWLEQRTPTGKTGKSRGEQPADAGLTMEDVRAWLLLQEKTTLVDMLVEAAGYDSQLTGSLMMKAAGARGVNMVTCREVLDQAIGIILLIRFDSLGQKIVADSSDDVLRMLLFVHYPAHQLILRLRIGFAGKLGNQLDGLFYRGRVLEHQLDTGMIVIDSARDLAVGLGCLRQRQNQAG